LSSRPDFTLWLLWAVKEAAYKLISRTADTVFSPVKFATVTLQGELSGEVRFQEHCWFWQASEGKGWLHAWVVADILQPARVQWCVEALDGNESEGVRNLALRLLARTGHLADGIRGRPPEAFLGLKPLPGFLSLSHDEGFGAAAWLPVS
jgi:hypothetical protein